MNNKNNQLTKLRTKIDNIDKEIVKLLNKRAEFAHKIGDIKRAHHLPVYVPHREEQVIANVQKNNSGPLSNEAIVRIYGLIIDESRRLEQKDLERKRRRNTP